MFKIVKFKIFYYCLILMNEWKEILFTYDDVEAEIVKDLLELENIQVVVNSMKISPFPVSIGRMGEIKLLVRKEDFEKAKETIQIMKNSQEQNNDN
jgi:hypothetical protein